MTTQTAGTAEHMADETEEEGEPNSTFSPETLSILLDDIRAREIDTRAVATKHVEQLCSSISEIGLIHPIVVDQTGALLAGGHRLAAIACLRDKDAEAYERWFGGGKVPVRVIPIDSSSDGRKALEIEVSENEKRRDYTAKDVQGLLARLKDAGYSTRLGGPSGGKRHINEALAAVIGKSERTVRRMLQTRHKPEAGGDPAAAAARAMVRAMHRFLRVTQEHPSDNPKLRALRRWVASGPASQAMKHPESASESDKLSSRVA